MLIVTKRRYKKQHVIGGAGIFDTVANFFKRLVTSNAAKEIARKALDVGKTVAIDAGKKLVDKATSRIFSPAITQKSKDALASLLNEEETTNINNMLMGRGVKNAVAIQDLVKRLNGAGMKKISY